MSGDCNPEGNNKFLSMNYILCYNYRESQVVEINVMRKDKEIS